MGASGGIEEKLVPRAGYPLELLELGSLNKVSLARRIRTMILFPFSFCEIVLRFLLVRKPDAVLGVGGYASGPLVLDRARFLKVSESLARAPRSLEQNSVPGMTNRWLGTWVDTVFCAFPGTETSFREEIRPDP